MVQNGWRPMAAADIPVVARISDAVHGRYTERPEVYAERLALYPAGCFVLQRDADIVGYLICHPWHGTVPPALDALLERIPAPADWFYLHDLALLPAARGTGAGRSGSDLAVAEATAAGFDEVRLAAVNGAESFWGAQGFVVMDMDADYAASAYGGEALFMRRLL